MRQHEDGKQNMGKEVIPPDTERAKTSCDSHSHSGVCDSSRLKPDLLCCGPQGHPSSLSDLLAKVSDLGWAQALPPLPSCAKR